MDETKFSILALMGILAVTEPLVELAADGPDSSAAQSALAFDTLTRTSLAPALPHIDLDLRPDFPSLATEITASGASAQQGYILQLRPCWIRDGWKVPSRLVLDIIALPTFPGAHLLAHGVSLERACSVLGKMRPRAQLRAIRESLLRGRTTEIGGHVSFARFVFRESQVKKLRLGFYSPA